MQSVFLIAAAIVLLACAGLLAWRLGVMRKPRARNRAGIRNLLRFREGGESKGPGQ